MPAATPLLVTNCAVDSEALHWLAGLRCSLAQLVPKLANTLSQSVNAMAQTDSRLIWVLYDVHVAVVRTDDDRVFRHRGRRVDRIRNLRTPFEIRL